MIGENEMIALHKDLLLSFADGSTVWTVYGSQLSLRWVFPDR